MGTHRTRRCRIRSIHTMPVTPTSLLAFSGRGRLHPGLQFHTHSIFPVLGFAAWCAVAMGASVLLLAAYIVMLHNRAPQSRGDKPEALSKAETSDLELNTPCTETKDLKNKPPAVPYPRQVSVVPPPPSSSTQQPPTSLNSMTAASTIKVPEALQPAPRGGPQATKYCRFFRSKAGCRNGDDCPFSHSYVPQPNGGEIQKAPIRSGDQQPAHLKTTPTVPPKHAKNELLLALKICREEAPCANRTTRESRPFDRTTSVRNSVHPVPPRLVLGNRGLSRVAKGPDGPGFGVGRGRPIGML